MQLGLEQRQFRVGALLDEGDRVGGAVLDGAAEVVVGGVVDGEGRIGCAVVG